MFLESSVPVVFAPGQSMLPPVCNAILSHASVGPLPINLTAAEIRALVMEVLG